MKLDLPEMAVEGVNKKELFCTFRTVSDNEGLKELKFKLLKLSNECFINA